MNSLVEASALEASSRSGVLLIGPPGAGKRTVARATAAELRMEFAEIRLDLDPHFVKATLFGDVKGVSSAQADRSPPGEAGRASRTMLYLAGLEGLSEPLHQDIHRLLTRRSYLDSIGCEWRVSEDVWLVGALKSPWSRSVVHPEHWLCGAFGARIRVDPPIDPDDLLKISSSITAGLGRIVIAPSASRVLASIRYAPDNLHALRRWLEMGGRKLRQGDLLNDQHIRNAMVDDLEWALGQISYRGYSLSVNNLQEWVEQFPDELRPIAIHLVRRIADTYYIGQRRYHECLQHLIQASGIPRASRVVFCKWQLLGESGERVANILKAQAGWRTESEIDLLEESWRWPNLRPDDARWFILADDFIGSGGTLTSLLENPRRVLLQLLTRYPGSQVRILVVAGFELGLRRVHAALSHCEGRARLIPKIVFGEQDRCFHPRSSILPDPEQQERLKRFCHQIGEQQMRRLPTDFRLGYQDIGAIVVFFDSVPNNSLPVLWFDGDRWKALFPRSGLPGNERATQQR